MKIHLSYDEISDPQKLDFSDQVTQYNEMIMNKEKLKQMEMTLKDKEDAIAQMQNLLDLIQTENQVGKKMISNYQKQINNLTQQALEK